MAWTYAQKLYFYENIYHDSREESLDIYWSVSQTGSLNNNMGFPLSGDYNLQLLLAHKRQLQWGWFGIV